MTWLRQFLFRLKFPFRRRRIEAELAEELRSHLEMAAAAREAQGLTADEARRNAVRDLGGITQAQETYRDARGFPWIDSLIQDIRIAARSLGKSRGYLFTAGITLALGLGIVTATYSFLRAIALQPLEVAEPERVVQLFRTSPQTPFGRHSPADLLDVAAQNEVFAHFAIVDTPDYSLASPGEPPEQVSGGAVSGEFFAVLGVPPLLGRVFGAAEDRPGHNQIVVLSHAFWQRRFGGDPSVIGRRIRLDGDPVEIIGVMPESFSFPQLWGRPDLWKPLALEPTRPQARDGYWLNAIARLKPGVTFSQAQANLSAIAARLAREYPKTNANSGYFVGQLGRHQARQGSSFFWKLMGLAIAVLGIACANLANLQLARGSRRIHEYALRVALGASRSRLVRLVLVESLLLALLGGVGGVTLSGITNHVLAGIVGRIEGDASLHLPMDWQLLGFAFVITVCTGVLFGIAPAALAAGLDPKLGLRRAGPGVTADRSRHRLRETLIVAELALTLVLMAAAGYLVTGLYRDSQRDFGWRQDHLLTARFALPAARYGTVEQCAAFYQRLNDEVSALPGVADSATCDLLPVYGFYNQRPIVAETAAGTPSAETATAYVNTTTPGYFGVLGMRLISGRDFTAADRQGSPAVVIVDETLARQLWPGESALGKHLGGPDPAQREWMEVVGVVNEVGFRMDENPPTRLQIYRPMAQTGGNYLSLVARTQVEAGSLTEQLRRAVARIDPDLAAYQVTSIEQMVDLSGSGVSIILDMLIIMAGTGLLLSAVGIFGVISNLVVERTNEIGIRMALGAEAGSVVRMVLHRGLRLAGLGIALGAAGAVAIVPVLSGFMLGLRQSPPVVAGVAVALLVVMLLACWLPARRAARVDPIVALRTE